MRVEVVPGEEVQEKIMMTPGDVSMLLNETNGLRVQTTSPSLGGANVRIQGLRGTLHADPGRRPAALRRADRIDRAAADPADGPRPGRSDQGRGVRALWHVGDRRRRESRVAAAAGDRTRAGSARQRHQPRRRRRGQLAGGSAQRALGLHVRRRPAHAAALGSGRGRLDRPARVPARGRPAAALLGRRRGTFAARRARAR